MRHSIILIALVTLVIVFPTGCATSSSSLEAMPSNLNLIQLPGLVAMLDDDLLPQFQQEQKFISKPTFRLSTVEPIKSIALLNIPNPPLFYLGKKIKPLTFLHASTSSNEGSAAIVQDTGEHENFDYAAISGSGKIESSNMFLETASTVVLKIRDFGESGKGVKNL